MEAKPEQAPDRLGLTEVASGLGFPEAPVAMNDGTLLFVDIANQTLSKLHDNKVVDTIATIPGGPNGLAIGPDGAAYVCNNGHIYDFMMMPPPNGPLRMPAPVPSKAYMRCGLIQRVDLETRKVTTLYQTYIDDHGKTRKLWTPDDIVFDRSGTHFWFTDSGIQGPHNIKKGGLFYAAIDGSSIRKVATIPTANGVALSPDGMTVYVSDTVFGRLYAFGLKSANTGDLVDPPTFDPSTLKPGMLPYVDGRVLLTLPSLQWVDSIKVDASGNVCIATLLRGGITVYDPSVANDPARMTETDFFPVGVGPLHDMFTTNLCFGGKDMTDVWITASSTGKIYKGTWPRPGLRLAYTAPTEVPKG